MEIHQRDSALHRESQADVVDVVRIRSSIPISKQTILTKRIVVGARFAFCHGYSRDTERNLAEPWLEDALRSHQRNALALVVEPPLQDFPKECAVFRGQ